MEETTFFDIEGDTLSQSTVLQLQSSLTQNPNFWDEFPTLSTILNPISSTMDSTSLSLSLQASHLYLSLFLSPNAPLFSLFTPLSFLSLLRSVRLSFKSADSSNQRPRGKKARARVRVRVRVSNSDDDDHDCEVEGGGSASVGEIDVKLLFSVLDKLPLVLDLVHLGRFPDSLKSLVQTIAEISVTGIDFCVNNSVNCNKLIDFCSRVLRQVLRPEHGEQQNTAVEVLKSLYPLMLSTKSSQSRNFALLFVRNEMMGMAKDSTSLRKAMVNFPRYIAEKAPATSDGRALAVESIIEIVKAMEFCDQVGFVDHLVKMSQGKSQLRYLAVDLIPKLMVSVQVVSDSDSEGGIQDSWQFRCLMALIQRCSDSVAGIRARALSSLAQLAGSLSGDERNCVVLKKVLGLECGKDGSVIELLKKRCADEKAAVRKAALLLISKLMGLVGGSLDPGILKMMGKTCSDPLVSIRKAAISALSEAFRIYSDRSVIIEWLHSVPRLIIDSETSIQEECENLFMELILDRVSRAGSAACHGTSTYQNSNTSSQNYEKELSAMYAGGIMDLLREICDGQVTPWVKKLCTSLGKKKKLKPKLCAALQNIIKTSESLWLSHSMPIENWTAPPGAWLLLSEVSIFLPKAVDWEFLLHHWKLLDKDETTVEINAHTEEIMHESTYGTESNSVHWAGDRVLLLQTISNVSAELSPEPAAQLAHDLLKRIEGFNMHSTEINAHVKALKTLCRRKAMSHQEADTLVTKSVDQLFCKASHVIDMYLSEEQKASESNNLFTPQRSSCKKGKREAFSSRFLVQQATTAVYTIGSLVIICPSLDVKSIVPVLYSMITSGTPKPSSTKLPVSVSIKEKAPSLYIQAWLTMGKICLADGKLAKRYIPLFIQELEKSDCAALRNNIIVIMADFCVRYTALVDCYISKITKCLRDSCELVRRQTFILLSRLLQTDYVKWRGVLFLRFLLSLVDESEKIRQLADYLFGNILKAKAPLLAYNSFVEAVYVLNDCHAHKTNNKSANSRVESRIFSIRGNDEKSCSKRMHIYVSLLKQMAPEHLLATFAKICAEILAAASDGILSVDEVTGQSVLQDAFRILTCKEIRLPSNRGLASDTAEIDEEAADGSGASSDAVRGRAITQAVKKSLIQNTIPIFIELKRLLESKHSPLIGSLMECLRVLLKDYKNEIEDILVADKQLQKELIYDMQKYENVKAKSTAVEAIATMNDNKSHSYHTPGGANDATNEKSKLSKKLHTDKKVASAMEDVAAASVAKSILKEVNKGALTPPLSLLKMPRLRTSERACLSKARKSADVIESLRRHQIFDYEEGN